MSTQVTVSVIPDCDLCKASGQDPHPAIVDGKTTVGPWAFMCQAHFDAFGVGLGTGRGQRLTLAGQS